MMSKVDTDIRGAIKKIVYGGLESETIDLLVPVYEMYSEKESKDHYLVADDLTRYIKIFGESIFTDTKGYVEALRFDLRKELATKHSLLETLRIYVALNNLGCRLIRVSKTSENYENVRVIKEFANMDGSNLPYSLFRPMSLLK